MHAPLDETAKAARQFGEALCPVVRQLARLNVPIDKIARLFRPHNDTLGATARAISDGALAWQKLWFGQRDRLLNEEARRYGLQRERVEARRLVHGDNDDLAFFLALERRRWMNKPLSELFPKRGTRHRKSDVEAFIAVKDLLSRKDLSDYSACRLVARDLGLPLWPFYKRWRAKQRA